ncbi:MAG: hypothetical protein L0216_12720, partial [Planctomycetales bacterium]|nr:hypothetical protein [Planctomycetales bacterium]
MAERSAWNWLLGTPDADPGAEWRVRFLAAPPLWVTLLVVVPALILFAAWLYRRSGAPTAGSGRRFAMAAARFLALLLLVLMLYDPILSVERFVTRQSTVAVLVDDSLSMSLKDRYADAKRPEAAREARERLARAAGLLGEHERLTPAAEERLAGTTRLEMALAAIRTAGPAFLGRLGETHRVRLYAFSSRLAREPDLAKLVPAGTHTKLGDAILEALADLRGELVAGVVVLTDGRSNAGEKGPVEAAREAAGRDSGVPIHAVGVGSSELPRDLVLSQVQAPDLILKDDQWEVEYTLSHQGYGGERVQVSVRRDSPEGPEIAGNEVTLREDGEPQREKIVTRRFEQPGDYVLHLVVPVQKDETTPENNQAVLRLRVLDEKLRVLYVDGEPRYEYRHLSQALIRDEKLRANVLLASADQGWPQRRSLSGGVPELQRFPESERDLFQFDAVIVGDVDPLASQGLFTRPEGPEGQLAMIEKFVKDLGGGLIFSAGPQANPARYAGTPLESLLPVTLLKESATPLGGEDAEVFPERTPEGRNHAILSLDADRGRNERLWSDPQYRLTGFWRTEPVGREKPSAEVFLRHPTAHPPGSDEGRPI